MPLLLEKSTYASPLKMTFKLLYTAKVGSVRAPTATKAYPDDGA